MSSRLWLCLWLCLWICPLPMQFFSRPLICPQIAWSDLGLLLVYHNSVSLMRTLRTFNLMMVSLRRTLKRSITCTTTCNLMMVSLMRTLKRSITCTITYNLLMVSLMRTLKRSITCNILLKKMCSWRPSELCHLDENSSIICNLLMKNSGGKLSVLLSASVERFGVSRIFLVYLL